MSWEENYANFSALSMLLMDLKEEKYPEAIQKEMTALYEHIEDYLSIIAEAGLNDQDFSAKTAGAAEAITALLRHSTWVVRNFRESSYY